MDGFVLRSSWSTRITAVAFISLTGAFGLNLAIGQFIPPLMGHFGWSLAATSGTVAASTLMWGLAQPVMGRLIDRSGPRAVMAVSAALMGLAYLLLATITEFWQFVLLFGVVVAIGFAGCSSMPASVLVTRWHVRRRPQALAISSMGINAGQLLLLPLAGVLISAFGWQAAFAILGCVMLAVVAPTIWFGARNSPGDIGLDAQEAPAPTPAAASLRHALADPQFWLIALSFAGCGYSLYMFTTHMPKLAVELGLGASAGGWLMALVAVCSAASMWATGQWAAKLWGKRRPLLVLHLVRIVGFLVLAFAGTGQFLLLAVVLFGLSSFPVIPLTTGLIADRFGGTAMGGILGSAWLIHQLFAALGVLIGGVLHDATGSYRTPFLSGAAVLLASTVLTWFIRERRAAALEPTLQPN
ncbi:MFS transporter [Rhodococcus sp. HNM0563]|uniref:MFS transporter n=1 Tax=unclassified Rhodococcus (in: high G+C Gram-positive bacteria) TaxID=192944 RepID=UPI001469DD54|nr:MULTISPECIES: MFS transporter [unclassified Rhodococcus (in: high G+C Gram-positive bacteria)]MCK0093470.1 MFS transporter [Rhodococcus sp. F64268]NLU64815.1 MFS transporter [Rhodococcus sp. HNM0563]